MKVSIMLDTELKSKVNQLWNKFWSGKLTNSLQAIEQMFYLLFISYLESFGQKLTPVTSTFVAKTKNLIIM